MNARIFMLWFLVLFSARVVSQTDKSVLIGADEAFNKDCRDKGFRNAFLSYADDSLIKMNNRALPVIGKAALVKWLDQQDPQTPLQWKPVKAEIAASEDLGYTFGVWKLPVKDTTYYGNYVTIWKKQKDGSWKYVLDTGTSTPKPEGFN